MSNAKKLDAILTKMQPYGVCVVDPESTGDKVRLLFCTAVTFAESDEAAVRRVRMLYRDKDGRPIRDRLLALPVFHPAVKAVLAADDEDGNEPLTPTAAIAMYARLESELIADDMMRRVRKRRRNAERKIKVAGQGREAVKTAIVSPVVKVKVDPFTVVKSRKPAAGKPTVVKPGVNDVETLDRAPIEATGLDVAEVKPRRRSAQAVITAAARRRRKTAAKPRKQKA